MELQRATSLTLLKQSMGEKHVSEPNAVKSISELLRDRNVPRDMISSLQSVSPKQLDVFVEATFSVSSVSRPRRSITGTVGAILSAREAACFIYNMANTLNITRQDVIAFVNARAPRWMRGRVMRALSRGMEFLSKFMKIICKTTDGKPELARTLVMKTTDDEIEILDRALDLANKETGSDNYGNSIAPLYANLPFCLLSALSREESVSEEEMVQLIQVEMQEDEQLVQDLVRKVRLQGVKGIQSVSFLACQLTPSQSDVYDIEVNEDGSVALGIHIPVKVIAKIFCALWQLGAEEGATVNEVISFIERKFPLKWKKHLMGQLALKGIEAVVDIAGAMCGVKRGDEEFLIPKYFDFSDRHHAHILSYWLNQAINNGLNAASPSIHQMRQHLVKVVEQTEK